MIRHTFELATWSFFWGGWRAKRRAGELWRAPYGKRQQVIVAVRLSSSPLSGELSASRYSSPVSHTPEGCEAATSHPSPAGIQGRAEQT